ncbi:MAG TPA: ferric reductase-like transmembrane domain-containing protein [Verrucomicrobiae bacterium]|nr:ferric reductase-like transmembrane domain-containing protein [Verrucomicrobiae bacterium]
MKENDIRFTKLLVLVNAGVPLVLLAWDSVHHQLGANPVNFIILTTGMLALVFLMLTLLVTPLRRITGWNWLIFSRRTLGLYAFTYASLHFLIFFSLDRSFSVSSTVHEMLRRKYLLVGITGLLAMVPLALTSTNAMIKRLGGKRWRALHRLTYVAAIAGVIHYYMQVKADVRKPLAFAAVLSILLAYRLIPNRNRPKPSPDSTAKPKFWSGPLRIARIVKETPDVRTFRFVSPDGQPLPFQHLPGQYLILSLQIDGKKVNRTYTIASSPARPDYCEVTVKREENGLASGHLHEKLREGDIINVSAPAGRFTFDGSQSKSIVLIAGGVGITPLMSILRYLTDRSWQGDIHFLYCAKSPQDIIFRQELADLQKRFPNLHLHITLTRAEGADWNGPKGRISAEVLKKIVPDLATHPVYICGPASMMEPTIQLLHELGVPADQIKSEAFVAAKRAEAAVAPSDSPAASTAVTSDASPSISPAGDSTPTLTFARSAKSVPLAPEKTLLELGEDAGLDLDYECRSGICGRCKARMLAGSVTMEVQDALDETDKSKNYILLCQAKSSGDVTIEA